MEELNKKLAEWAGFKVKAKVIKGSLRQFPSTVFELYDPNNKECRFFPDFTQSLDACFKWLVPEAIKRFGTIPVYYAACEAMYAAIEAKEFRKKCSTLEALYDGKPALALCLAIEKLIDGGNDE